mgnify:CR=1 FL=1
MAKDGTARGGQRVGSGRKSKALAEKLNTGNPGGRKLTVMELPADADLSGEDMPEIKSYMKDKQKKNAKQQEVKKKTSGSPKMLIYFVLPAILLVAWWMLASRTFNSKPDLNGDNFCYYTYATAMATGHGYADLSSPGNPPTANFPPGYPMLMLPLRLITDSIVAQKWLNDRKGMTLTFEDVKHYQRIIYVLQQTERIMTEIDNLMAI